MCNVALWQNLSSESWAVQTLVRIIIILIMWYNKSVVLPDWCSYENTHRTQDVTTRVQVSLAIWDHVHNEWRLTGPDAWSVAHCTRSANFGRTSVSITGDRTASLLFVIWSLNEHWRSEAGSLTSLTKSNRASDKDLWSYPSQQKIRKTVLYSTVSRIDKSSEEAASSPLDAKFP